MQCARDTQRKRGYFCIERGAIIGDHLVTTLHRADWRFQNRAAGILKTGPGQEVRLLTYDPFTVHLTFLLVGIGNNPVPRHQARRHGTGIGNCDGVRKHVTILARFGLAGEIGSSDVNLDLVFVGDGHGLDQSSIRGIPPHISALG